VGWQRRENFESPTRGSGGEGTGRHGDLRAKPSAAGGYGGLGAKAPATEKNLKF